MSIKRIGIDHIKDVAHQLAIATMNWDEPIPAFETRFPKVLESCLSTPFQTYNRKDLYPTLEDKAAILFYLLIKNHPFQNGNKRIAVTTLMVFLLFNEKWSTIQPAKLYNLAIWVAQSDTEVRDAVIAGIRDLITKYSKNIK
jgi:death-on-curing family protein